MEIIGIGILLLVLAAGFVVFFIARKVMKMAVRLAIVGVVLLVVIVGGISLWYFNSSKGGANQNRPPATKPAR
jgi:EamA domain-containing membrane protein RarD